MKKENSWSAEKKEKEEYIWRRKIFGPQNRRRMERERGEDI